MAYVWEQSSPFISGLKKKKKKGRVPQYTHKNEAKEQAKQSSQAVSWWVNAACSDSDICSTRSSSST